MIETACSRRSMVLTARRLTSLIFVPPRSRAWTPNNISTTTPAGSPRRLTCPLWATAGSVGCRCRRSTPGSARTAVRADPGVDRRHWQLTEPEVAQSGQVSLRGLPAGVVVEVLFGVQARLRGGTKIKDVNLRAVSTMLRRVQAVSVMAGQPESLPARPARALFTAIVRDARRALADPGRERAGDVWDLALFGHCGRLSFTGISQPWLADAAKVLSLIHISEPTRRTP